MDKIEEVLEEAKKQPNTTLTMPIQRSKVGMRQFFKMFSCQRCGECCTTFFEYVEFTEREFNQIKKYLPQGGRSKFKKVGKVYRTSAAPCLFYSKRLNGCKIYKDRPNRCKTYPAGYTVDGSPYHLAAHTGCPAACEVIKESWAIAGLYGVRPK